ncbi:unnamed protein product [Hymenolepis diminuta]|uniref:Uncharacterized protein n=1 Tax=Hymenolepis diminuta TaxID=6216 RepID=A0A3P6ZA51_HYMDI|nr:unnamed protein product [Hymenolepis diminuta]
MALLHRLLLNTGGGGNSSHLSSPVPPQRRRLSTRKIARGLELNIANCLGRLYSRLAAAVVTPNPLNIASSVQLHVSTTADYTFFPLVVIISTLERYAVQQNLPTNWVPAIFGDAKIPPSPEVVEAYNIIICKKDPFWMRENVRSRLMEVIYIFVAEFIDSPARLSPRQRYYLHDLSREQFNVVLPHEFYFIPFIRDILNRSDNSVGVEFKAPPTFQNEYLCCVSE